MNNECELVKRVFGGPGGTNTQKGSSRLAHSIDELYHHIVSNQGLEICENREEREASRFVRKIMRKSWLRFCYARAPVLGKT